MSHHRRGLLALMALAFIPSLLAPSRAAAQGLLKTPGRVKLLKLNMSGADVKIADTTTRAITDALRHTPGLTWTKVGQVTMNELFVALGCNDLKPACSKTIRETLNVEYLAYGTVKTAADKKSHTLSWTLVDLRSGESIIRADDRKVSGDATRTDALIPAMIDETFFGQIGVLEIQTNGARGAVRLDGNLIAKVTGPPATIQNLPLGAHRLTFTPPGKAPITREVILRRGQTARVSFTVARPAVAANKSSGGGLNTRKLAGWVGIGAGLVFGATGALQHVRLQNLEDEAAAKYGGRTSLDASDLGDAKSRQDSMNATLTRRNILFGVGAVGLITGATLLLLPGGESSSTSGASLDLQLAPGRAGVQVTTAW